MIVEYNAYTIVEDLIGNIAREKSRNYWAFDSYRTDGFGNFAHFVCLYCVANLKQISS